jgi:hypothetical protein
MRLRGTIAVLSALSLATLALAGCSAGGNSTAGAGGGSSSGSGGTSAGNAATATFSGDLTGTIQMNVCTGTGADSIFLLVKGDSTKYSGVVSADGVGFLGPKAYAWARDLDKNPTKPQPITSGSGGWTLDGVHVYYELPGQTTQEITLSGKVLCP